MLEIQEMDPLSIEPSEETDTLANISVEASWETLCQRVRGTI